MTTTINNKHNKLNFSSEREQSQACLNSAEHEKNQGRKVLNVPNLRFKEFQGEWEKTTIGEIATIKNGPFGSVLHAEDYVDEGMPIVTTEHFKSGNLPLSKNGIPQVSEDDYCRLKGYMLETDDIVFSRVGSVDINAHVEHVQQGWLFSGRVLRVRPIKSVNSLCLHYVLSTESVKRDIRNRAVGQTMPSINTPILSNTGIYMSQSEAEQKKIANLLSLIDERIATQNKIIEDLKKLKSAIIEKVFCYPNQKNPMCRIEGFEQALSTYKMSDFSSRIATKNKDSKCSLVLTIAAQYGLVNQESFFNKSVASENLTGYYLLHKGEFAYNRSYSAGYDWGAVKRLDNYDEGVLSTLYICFKINETIVDSDYLTYYFESTKWHRGLSDIAGEGARNHGLLNVSITDYFNTKHRFPVIEEQKAIAKMLNTITEKERKATLLGECYQKQKQYLLRQMFI